MKMHNARQLGELYRELQQYVRWEAGDAELVQQAKPLIEPYFPMLIDDFYTEILRHPGAAAVLTEGPKQVERLKKTLLLWLNELFTGNYDADFVSARWNVGKRHVEIGLDGVFASVALSRLRNGMLECLRQSWTESSELLHRSESALNKLIDLDVATIELAYQQHFSWKVEQHARQQRQQTERLAAIGQMVTGLAHESRNLLQRSHACLEALLLDINDRPDAFKQAKRIQQALDQLHVLYEEVRNYAAPMILELGPVDLRKLLRHSWQQLESKWNGRNHQFSVQCPGDNSCSAYADAYRLEQVFTNLFQNAIDACGDSTKIVCDVRPVDSERTWRITISDNGPGIAPDLAGKVFDPFFTTKSQGTGLGMAISRRIVEAHGGTIGVGKSDLGGAEIRIDLPYSPSSPTSVELA